MCLMVVNANSVSLRSNKDRIAQGAVINKGKAGVFWLDTLELKRDISMDYLLDHESRPFLFHVKNKEPKQPDACYPMDVGDNHTIMINGAVRGLTDAPYSAETDQSYGQGYRTKELLNEVPQSMWDGLLRVMWFGARGILINKLTGEHKLYGSFNRDSNYTWVENNGLMFSNRSVF